LKPDVTTVEA